MADQIEPNPEEVKPEDPNEPKVQELQTKPNPSDPLQKLPVRKYLDQTIVPLLLAGMTEIVKERYCLLYLLHPALCNLRTSQTHRPHRVSGAFFAGTYVTCHRSSLARTCMNRKTIPTQREMCKRLKNNKTAQAQRRAKHSRTPHSDQRDAYMPGISNVNPSLSVFNCFAVHNL